MEYDVFVYYSYIVGSSSQLVPIVLRSGDHKPPVSGSLGVPVAPSAVVGIGSLGFKLLGDGVSSLHGRYLERLVFKVESPAGGKATFTAGFHSPDTVLPSHVDLTLTAVVIDVPAATAVQKNRVAVGTVCIEGTAFVCGKLPQTTNSVVSIDI